MHTQWSRTLALKNTNCNDSKINAACNAVKTSDSIFAYTMYISSVFKTENKFNVIHAFKLS